MRDELAQSRSDNGAALVCDLILFSKQENGVFQVAFMEAWI
jgi:hypothetical protein